MRDFEHLWHHTIESEYLVLDALGKHPGRSYELLDYLRRAVASAAAKRGVSCAAEDFDRAATTERPLASVVRSYLRSIADIAVRSGATDLNLRERPELVINAELAAEQHASSALDCIIAASLKCWFSERDEMMESRAVGWPACWGGQFRVDEFGGYVSKDAFFEALPTERDRNLYYCCCDCYSDEDWIDVAENVRDDAWLDQAANEYTTSDRAVVYYTECSPSDGFALSELVELAHERPDLFTLENLRDHADLVRPALDAGIDCTLDGEPTWYCKLPVAGSSGLRKLSDLEESFDIAPQLARDREMYGTCEAWISDLERMGVLETVSNGSAKAASRTPGAVAAAASRTAASAGGEPVARVRATHLN